MAEKSDNKTPSYLLIGVLVLLAVVFVAIMFSNFVADCIHPFSGVSTNSVSKKIEECVGLLLGLPGKKKRNPYFSRNQYGRHSIDPASLDFIQAC